MNFFEVYARYEVEPVYGKGAYVFDKNGTPYLDFYGGHAVISIGHGHPHYIQRIQDQLHQLPFYSNAVPNRLQDELAEKLGSVSGLESYQLFLCNSGAEANENALKLASFQTGKKKVIAFEKAFHGRTSAAVNVTDNAKIQAPINQTFEVEFHAWGALDALEVSLSKGDVCAVIIEGIQGIGGVHIPVPDFLRKLAALCKQYEVLLILDEIQSGYGRSGHFFAFQQTEIQPDLVTVAKGMGNGFPIGGVLVHSDIQPVPSMLGSTFGGSHLACSAGLAVLEVIKEENLLHNAQVQGAKLVDALQQLEGVKEVRAMGLMIGLEMAYNTANLRKHLLYEQQVFTGSASCPNTLRLLPPLTITDEETNLFIEKIKLAIPKLEVV
ncbi:MAG: aminotransferase class III-fold pyridoxal phosphate-dependent enzyme [Saprospiraceae bacterium]|nr:aminotransferase class III-fold pyridoxal phosphate-dependent enzyme [Saprospiraceae bacterium]